MARPFDVEAGTVTVAGLTVQLDRLPARAIRELALRGLAQNLLDSIAGNRDMTPEKIVKARFEQWKRLK